MSCSFFCKLDNGVNHFMRWTCVLTLVLLLFLIGAGVFVRFVPIASLAWTDEIIEFLLIWLVFMGAAWLWRDSNHFRVDLLPLYLGDGKCGLLAQGAVNFLGLIFMAVLGAYGWLLAWEATDISPMLFYPKTIWYLPIPLACFIMVGYSLRDIVKWWHKICPQGGAPSTTGSNHC